MQNILKKIYDYSLEEIMGERFGRYSKTVIQDRALPDVRDGLKPVQRRILYAMYKDKNTYDKAYKKSAKTVGNVMGQYHPHGDSSIYEAMVRMCQWWKQNAVYVDMHGNNGSMDGDSPAAMRYTEARLSKISNELLRDIDKETVMWAPNYDDTLLEPTVLPSKVPNLLINGSTGISSGYATNIPPHNLGEVIDATIKRIDSPNCYLDSILDIVKGPDFPTGGIVEGAKGIRDAYKTGRGKIIIRSKLHFEKEKGKNQIIITEIPFEVNKASLVKKMDEIRLDKKIDGIIEVRDETDREGLQIAIDLKKDADRELILNYLLKNTELQVSYSFNIVAIVNRRPMVLGILEILDAYIEHQKEVITKRTEFDLEHAKARMHIVEGLIKALSILDEVIATIRASKNKTDAKNNLVIKYDFTELQAEAIVMLQLYKLTNTDVTDLIEENKNLQLIIKGLEAILADPEKLKSVIKDELRKIKKEYAVDRKTEIKEHITEIKIDTTQMLPKEDCIVVATKDGYVKRVSPRSYSASDNDETQLKDGDYVIGLYNMNTMDTLILFTDLGNYLYIPVHELPDLKWKDLGKHVSNIIQIKAEENIIYSLPVYDFDQDINIVLFSKDGMIKQTKLSDFKVQRYSKPMSCMKLKDKDKVISVTTSCGEDILIATHNGYALRYDISEVPATGIKTGGVKSINLKNDYVISGDVFNNNDYLTVITEKSTGKRIKLIDIEKTSRARRGIQIIRDVKTNPYYIMKTYIVDNKEMIGLKTKSDIKKIKITELPIADRYSTGTVIFKEQLKDCFIIQSLKDKEEQIEIIEEKEEIEKNVSLNEIDERIMTIDDFLDDFKI
jgi:topoisomerase-4 subunit A